jgi:hypothetical protein
MFGIGFIAFECPVAHIHKVLKGEACESFFGGKHLFLFGLGYIQLVFKVELVGDRAVHRGTRVYSNNNYSLVMAGVFNWNLKG